MTKSRLKGSLVNSAGVPTSPLSPAPVDPALAAPAPAPATAPAPAPAPAVAPASAKPRSVATALIEKDIEDNLLAYQKSREDIVVLEADLDDLKDRYPRQYKEVADRLGIEEEEESGKNESKYINKQNGLSLILVVLIILALIFLYRSYTPTPETSYQPPPQSVAESGKPADPAADSEVGMIIVPTSTVEAVATATAEATVEATAVPPTAIPPTAVPPTAIPPTAVPLPVFWNSNKFGVFEVGADGAVCSGDKVAGVTGDEVDGVKGPVTIAFPPNYGGVEVIHGRCVVNGGTAQQIADEDTSAWKKQFVVKEAP